jgi:ComEC/Rec2-related protein
MKQTTRHNIPTENNSHYQLRRGYLGVVIGFLCGAGSTYVSLSGEYMPWVYGIVSIVCVGYALSILLPIWGYQRDLWRQKIWQGTVRGTFGVLGMVGYIACFCLWLVLGYERASYYNERYAQKVAWIARQVREVPGVSYIQGTITNIRGVSETQDRISLRLKSVNRVQAPQDTHISIRIPIGHYRQRGQKVELQAKLEGIQGYIPYQKEEATNTSTEIQKPTPKEITPQVQGHIDLQRWWKISQWYNAEARLSSPQAITIIDTTHAERGKENAPAIKPWGVIDTLTTYATQIRGGIQNFFSYFFPFRERELAQGLIIGQERWSDEQEQEAFRESGLLHIVSVSGSNIAIILLLVYPWLWWLGRWVRSGVLLCCLLGFGMVVGFGVPVWRAIVMGYVGYMGLQSGRRVWSLGVLLGTLAIFCFISPPSLIFDASLHLSFGSVAGMLLVSRAYPQHSSSTIKSIMTATIGSLIGTFPITLWQFGIVGAVGIASNLFVLPVLPFIMLGIAALGVWYLLGLTTIAAWWGYGVYIFLWGIRMVAYYGSYWNPSMSVSSQFVGASIASVAWATAIGWMVHNIRLKP